MHNKLDYKEEIIAYYSRCWLERFEAGHNPKSLAMHMGYFEPATLDNDEAKVNMNRFLASHLDLQPTGKELMVVDAGCGVGSTCLFLARSFAGLSITGINISQQQIDMARTFMAKQGELKSKVNFIHEDFCHTSLLSESADVVFALESVCHADVKPDFFNEAYRILKPGGLLLLIDYVQTGAATAPEVKELVNSFQKGWAVNEYISAPAGGLSQAGFKNVSVESIRTKVMPGIIRSYKGAMKKISSLNGGIPDTTRKHLHACIALKKLSETGIIDYCLIKANK